MAKNNRNRNRGNDEDRSGEFRDLLARWEREHINHDVQMNRDLERIRLDLDQDRKRLAESYKKIDENLVLIRRSVIEKTWWQELLGVVRRTVTSPVRLFSATIALVGLISAFYSLLPRVSVSTGEIVDPDDVLKTLVTVSNDSVFSLSHVWFGCIVGDVYGAGAFNGKPLPDWKKQPPPAGEPLVLTGFEIPMIRPGQKATTNEFCPMDGAKSYVDVALTVHFQYLGWISQHREFRLVTILGADKRLIWMQQPD